MMLSPQIEEYLESIFKLQDNEGGLRISQLAENLDVSPAAVVDMLKKLKERGFVADNSSTGIRLTKNGASEAKNVVRKHRLTERFLTDILGMPWDSVHEEACKLEHAIGPEVAERLSDLLDNPQTCPHGHPVPGSDGSIKAIDSKPLSSLRPGESGQIVTVVEDDPRMLQYLASLGLLPGSRIEVVEIAPFNGPLLIAVSPQSAAPVKDPKRKGKRRGCRYALGREVTDKIAVEVS